MMKILGPAALPGHIAPARPDGAAAATPAGAEPVTAPQASRLIIDRDRQSGAYAFTVVNAKTGEVMSRLPVRAVSDIAAAADYRPGSIARLSV